MPFSSQPRRAPFEPVHLDFESGTFDGWSVKRLAGRAFGDDPVGRRARRDARLPLRAAARRLCLAGPPRRASRPLQRRLGRGGLVRLQHACSPRISPCPTRSAASSRNGTTRRSSAIRPASRRSPSATAAAGFSSPAPMARVASPEPDIRYEFASVADFPTRRLARFRLPRLLVAPRRFGDRGLARQRSAHRLARAARLRERGGGAVLQARRLLVAGRAEADRRLSRQLQPRAFLRGGRSVGRARRDRSMAERCAARSSSCRRTDGDRGSRCSPRSTLALGDRARRFRRASCRSAAGGRHAREALRGRGSTRPSRRSSTGCSRSAPPRRSRPTSSSRCSRRFASTTPSGAALRLRPPDGTPPKLERITRLAAQDLPTFFHAALRWWIGPAHFVRPAAALAALRAADTSAWYADYMLNLWRQRQRLQDRAVPDASSTRRCRRSPKPIARGSSSISKREPVFMRASLRRAHARAPLYRAQPGDRARADARPLLRAGGARLPRRAAAARPSHRRCRRQHRQPHAVLRRRHAGGDA